MFHFFCFFVLLIVTTVHGHGELTINKDAPVAVPEATSVESTVAFDDMDGMALVCFPGSQCAQYPAPIVFDAIVKEFGGDLENAKRASGSGYLFRSRRGFENDNEEVEKRAGSHGYLLRTRKSEEPEPTTRNTRGSYLFRTRKFDPNLLPERISRGAGYLFRTRKSVEDSDEEPDMEHEMMARMLRSSKGYLFRTRKSMMNEMPTRYQRGGSYLFRT